MKAAGITSMRLGASNDGSGRVPTNTFDMILQAKSQGFYYLFFIFLISFKRNIFYKVNTFEKNNKYLFFGVGIFTLLILGGVQNGPSQQQFVEWTGYVAGNFSQVRKESESERTSESRSEMS